MVRFTQQCMSIGFAIALSGSIASAAQPRYQQDALQLIGSLGVRDCHIHQIRKAESQGRDLLYLEDQYKHNVTIVDVTDAAHPTIKGTVALPSNFSAIEAVAGDAALVDDDSAQPSGKARSLSLVRLGDQRGGLKVLRTFVNVTAVSMDERRGLVYLVDQNGLQILQEDLLPNPETAREFDKRILYDR